MRFILTIDCDNAAFEHSPHIEVRRLLKVAADAMKHHENDGKLRDVNGNTVGSFRFEDDSI